MSRGRNTRSIVVAAQSAAIPPGACLPFGIVDESPEVAGVTAEIINAHNDLGAVDDGLVSYLS
jgi:hypothetical protein